MRQQNEAGDSSRAEIERTIKHVLVSDLSVAPEVIAASHSKTPLLGHGIGLDSMDTLSLVAGIEREFDLEIEDEDLAVGIFEDITSLAAFLEKQISRHRACERRGSSR